MVNEKRGNFKTGHFFASIDLFLYCLTSRTQHERKKKSLSLFLRGTKSLKLSADLLADLQADFHSNANIQLFMKTLNLITLMSY